MKANKRQNESRLRLEKAKAEYEQKELDARKELLEVVKAELAKMTKKG